MKKFLKRGIAALVLAALCGGGYFYFFGDSEPTASFKTAEVQVRDVVSTIDATGTLEPEDLVDVGARVSGEIVSFGKDKNGKEIDYGSEITEGSVIALIDDEIPQSDLLSAKAQLDLAKAGQESAKANLLVAQENLKQAVRNWERAKRLGAGDALSQSAYDAYLSEWEKATAEISVAKAQILAADAEYAQAQAGLKEKQRNLEYCVIRAPVDGVVIDRKVNVGQTVVSNMSASSLFLIAKDLKKMEVWASVNEADIGGIRPGQDVVFTVDAFPREKFYGKVGKIRLNATMSQNVVTYVVEVVTDNSNGRLLPYLSANLSFIVEKAEKVFAVPNAALRWKPEDSMLEADAQTEAPEGMRALWVQSAPGKVSPIFVKTGVRDGTFTQVISPDIREGLEIVVGVNTAAEIAAASSNPFMPKMPQRRKSNSSAKTSATKTASK